MPALNTGQVIALPPPYAGMYDRTPTVVVQNPYCIELENFNTTGGALKLRNGDNLLSIISAVPANIVGRLKATTDGADRVIAAVFNNTLGETYFYDVITGTATLLHTIVGAAPYNIGAADFAGYTFFLGDGFLTRYQAPATWVNSPYSAAPTITFDPDGACVYRNRLYMWATYLPYLRYSGVEAISGATAAIDLRSVFTRDAGIAFARCVTVSDSIQAQSLLMIVTLVGEVILYGGSYPESADWSLVGRFFIPAPIGANSIVDVQGDSFILTRSGIISARTLITSGLKAATEQSITLNISNRWKQIVNALRALNYNQVPHAVTAVWDAEKNRLIISFPYHVNRSGAVANNSFFLVYDLTLGAWTEHVGPSSSSRASQLEILDGTVYYASFKVFDFESEGAAVMTKETSSGFKDYYGLTSAYQDSYSAKIVSAPIPLPRDANARVTAIEPITAGDYYTAGKWKLVGDLGRVSTGQQTVSVSGTSVSKPLVSLGIDATYVQYQFDYETPYATLSSGIQFYGINVHYQQGGAR